MPGMLINRKFPVLPDLRAKWPRRRNQFIHCAFCVSLLVASPLHAESDLTSKDGLSIEGNRFRYNGRLFDMYGIRVASAIGKNSYADQLIAQLDDYRAYGVNAVTVFCMGSSGGHYDPFTKDGNDWGKVAFRDRMDRIIEACAERDMVVIVGVFYQWKDYAITPRSLADWDAAKNAVRTVARHLRVKEYRNVILNIANEQNSGGYSDEPWGRVRNVPDLLGLVRIAKSEAPQLLVGCGGYDHDKNIQLGLANEVDVLLFDTLGPDVQKHSGYYHDLFVLKGVKKPIVNVEMFGAWTKRFLPQGVFTDKGKEEYFREIEDAAARPGLGVFFFSQPWYQAASVGASLRYDLGGQGTKSDPGIRWWFEHLRETVSRPGKSTTVREEPL